MNKSFGFQFPEADVLLRPATPQAKAEFARGKKLDAALKTLRARTSQNKCDYICTEGPNLEEMASHREVFVKREAREEEALRASRAARRPSPRQPRRVLRQPRSRARRSQVRRVSRSLARSPDGEGGPAGSQDDPPPASRPLTKHSQTLASATRSSRFQSSDSTPSSTLSFATPVSKRSQSTPKVFPVRRCWGGRGRLSSDRSAPALISQSQSF
jgi:hypothetical protein